MGNIIFFDAHGRAWKACSADDADAVEFGPSGVARPITDEEAKSLGLDGEVTHHMAAYLDGRIVWGDWDLLKINE
jgi:hypothetical protein